MTDICTVKKKKASRETIEILLCLTIFALALLFGGPLKDGVINGFKICFLNIIPTLFPFFILSDLWSVLIRIRSDSILAGCFEKMFGISGEGFSVFILGNLCGFPLGAKAASEKYKNGFINESDLNSLSTICNNPSAAFVISGVGLGLFGSLTIGIFLYFSVLISAMIIGIIFKPKLQKSYKSLNSSRQNFNLIESIKSAGLSSITVSSYIIFFSAIIGVAKTIIKSSLSISLVSALLEVSSACTLIYDNNTLLGLFTLPLISFALSFSGLSVFLQAFSILPPFVSKKGYLLKKLLQGLLSALLTALFCIVI